MTRPQDPDSPADPRKRSHDSGGSGSSSSDEPSRKKNRKSKKTKDSNVIVNGAGSGMKNRRNSLGKAARDPRDEPTKKRRVSIVEEVVPSRSTSPVIDFDGLSRPSKQQLPSTFTLASLGLH